MPEHNVNINVPLLEKSFDLLKGFLEKVIGPTANELGQQFGDGLKIRRIKNQLRNFEKVKQMVDAECINVRQIDLKALFPYLQNVSLEEDENLQKKWANLFVNYIDTNRNMESHVYPSILAQLSTKEVAILDEMQRKHINLERNGRTNDPIGFTEEQIGNLLRLGILAEEPNLSIYGDIDNPKIEELQPQLYYMTHFGDSFIKACTR